MAGDARGIKALGDGAQEFAFGFAERIETLEHRCRGIAVEAVAQQDHPLHLDAHTLAVERGFA